MPLNIPALRATQRSIMNLDNPFHMDCWCCCIAGHALKANGIHGPRHLEPWSLDFSVAHIAAQLLGFDTSQQTLFCELHIGMDRELACARINELIEDEARNNRRAAAIQHEPDFSDFSREYKEEELVTA